MKASRFAYHKIEVLNKNLNVWQPINENYYPYQVGMNTVHLLSKRNPENLYKLQDVSSTEEYKKQIESYV